MTDAGRRRGLSRLAKLSPVIALALLCVIVFSMPLYILPYFLDIRMFAAPEITPEMRAEWVDSVGRLQAGTVAKLWGDEGSFDMRTSASWELLADKQSAYITTAGVEPFGLPADDAAFEPIGAYEREVGARVWAWTLTDAGTPPVVVEAVGDPETMEALEQEVERFKENDDPNTKPFKDVPGFLWGNASGVGAMTPVNSQLFEPQGGTGSGGEDYATMSSALRQGGSLWFMTVVLPGGTSEPMPNWTLPSSLRKLDPRSAEFRERLEKAVRADEVNVIIQGPLDTGSVPLRVPAGEDPADAAELGELLWPEIAGRAEDFNTAGVTTLDARQREATGGKASVHMMRSMYNSANMGGAWYEPDEIAPQTVLYVAVFDESPVPEPGWATRSWHGWQRFISMWFPFLFGGAFALLLISLVLSPTVFVIERRRATRERMAADLEEMRRDAHDKVYNRLSALSKRVAAAGDEATSEFAASLGEIATDIRGTVGELQGILGDSAHRTDAVLTIQPLADQIASVCTAQAARLGVEVVFDAAPDIPQVSPELGWDLQCVAEEAITNAVRHGSATRIAVSVAEEPAGWLTLSIVDDGSGTAVLSAADASGGSTGLAGMQARLAKHGATLEMVSGTVGTSLTARVPLG